MLAEPDNPSISLTAGLAGLFAGALVMASGEYVSVSSQRDAERAMLELERRELVQTPIVRNVIGGAIAIGVTYGIGSLIGAAGL